MTASSIKPHPLDWTPSYLKTATTSNIDRPKIPARCLRQVQIGDDVIWPKVRHATLGRLVDRLVDPRFQSIDYLNTFLLTYRVFTTGVTIISVLRCVLRDPFIQLASTKLDNEFFDVMLNDRFVEASSDGVVVFSDQLKPTFEWSCVL